MQVQIITNLDNGAGLEQDYNLLANVCRDMGHDVRGVHIHRPVEADHADLNIFLEVIIPSLLPLARRNWIVPNCEWWGAHWNASICKFHRVLCKTQDCLAIWNKKAPGKAVYIGWAAQDLHEPTVPKEIKFLHTAGKSQTKNTSAVIEAWRRHKIPYPLTVSAFKPEIARICRGVPNVRLIERFSADELRREINSSRFFLMPSKYEGYGHAIHEALGCRAVVLTTDGEPMRSFSGVNKGMLIPVEYTEPMADARASLVNVRQMAFMVQSVAEQVPVEKLDAIGDEARAGFLKDNAAFFQAVRRELANI